MNYDLAKPIETLLKNTFVYCAVCICHLDLVEGYELFSLSFIRSDEKCAEEEK